MQTLRAGMAGVAMVLSQAAGVWFRVPFWNPRQLMKHQGKPRVKPTHLNAQ
jgi:hypothetical protein